MLVTVTDFRFRPCMPQLGRSLKKMETPFIILGYSSSLIIHPAKSIHSLYMSLLSRLTVPCGRSHLILSHSISIFISPGKIKLRNHNSILRLANEFVYIGTT